MAGALNTGAELTQRFAVQGTSPALDDDEQQLRVEHPAMSARVEDLRRAMRGLLFLAERIRLENEAAKEPCVLLSSFRELKPEHSSDHCFEPQKALLWSYATDVCSGVERWQGRSVGQKRGRGH